MASNEGGHPRLRLEETFRNGVRLSIVAALDGVPRAEFGPLRDLLEVSDSVLSKQVAALEQAGYVTVHKGRVERRVRTWLAITPAGAEALRRHLRAVRDVATCSLTPQPAHAPRPTPHAPQGARLSRDTEFPGVTRGA